MDLPLLLRIAEKVGAVFLHGAGPRTPQAYRDRRTQRVRRRRGVELGVPTRVNQSLLALEKLREAHF
jgi:hypothetical protein